MTKKVEKKQSEKKVEKNQSEKKVEKNQSEKKVSPKPKRTHSSKASKSVKTAQDRYGQYLSDAKETLRDLYKVIKNVVTDPERGIQKSLSQLRNKQTLNVGGLLCIIFAICFCILAFDQFIAYGGWTVFNIIKTIIFSIIPPALLTVVFWAIHRSLHGEGGWEQYIFISGIAYLPAAVAMLLFAILGIGNIELVVVIGGFMISTIVLILNTSLIKILKLSHGQALILTPILLLVMIYTCKVLLLSLYM